MMRLSGGVLATTVNIKKGWHCKMSNAYKALTNKVYATLLCMQHYMQHCRHVRLNFGTVYEAARAALLSSAPDFWRLPTPRNDAFDGV